MPKRKVAYLEQKSKRFKNEEESSSEDRRVPFDYHSASSVHNFMLNDPIVDWLKFKEKGGRRRSGSMSNRDKTGSLEDFFL